MKMAFLPVILLALLVLDTHDVQAQVYDPYYYWDGMQYQQYWPQYDPYYELHIMHYQLYRQPYQIYPYRAYPIYPACCFVGGIFSPLPQVVIIHPRPHVIRRR